jgi:reactive intermediate/imine deaminase
MEIAMKIDSPRFGSLEISPDRIIEFPAGLAGFENLRRFSVFHPTGDVANEPSLPNYFILQSVDDPDVAFHIADPARLGFDYQIELSDEEVAVIDLADPADAVVAVMLIKDPDATAPLRAGLYAPLVINTRGRRALQHQLTRREFAPEPPLRRQIIATAAAPAAIGTYSQAVRAGSTIYLSGQIGLDPTTMQMVDGIDAQIVRVFENLKAVAAAAGASLDQAVKFNIYLTDLANFAKVNEVMAQYVAQPYPARAAVGVAALPRGALVEADAVLVVG